MPSTIGPKATAAIILAAGLSRRFGGNKLLTDWRGRPLIAHAISSACAAPVDEVLVVVGHQATELVAVVETYAQRPVIIVNAADYAEGMGASLSAGIKALGPDIMAVVIFLGDMPLVPLDMAAKGLEAVRAGAMAAAPVFDGGRGHPAVFRADVFPILAGLRGDQGARSLFDGLGGKWSQIACDDPGVMFDVDEPNGAH